jgi:hypothetical protein
MANAYPANMADYKGTRYMSYVELDVCDAFNCNDGPQIWWYQDAWTFGTGSSSYSSSGMISSCAMDS